MKLSASSTITSHRTVSLDAVDIIALVKEQHPIKEAIYEFGAPKQVKVTFEVPRGGDYSGRALDLTDETDLTVDVYFLFQKATD